MRRYEVGDWVKILRSDWPSEFAVGDIVQVKRAAPVPASGAYLDDNRDRYFTGYELEPAENPWTVADVKVGDTVRATKVTEGVVSFVYEDGDFDIGNDIISLRHGNTTVELVEAAKPVPPKVGYSFTPGLPVGTVIKTNWASAFRTTEGWVFSDKSESSEDSFNSNWKIDYLPEVK